MDEINEFFDLTKKFKFFKVSPGVTDGRVVHDPNFERQIQRRSEMGTEYAGAFKNAETADLEEAFSTLKDDDSQTISDDETDEVDPVYTKYRFHTYTSPNLKLPVYESKENILSAINKNRFVVIQGATGCGKSTQIPQFILDQGFQKKIRCNIVVTQPRRIAARSIAERVCYERGWELGSIVGYQMGLDSEHCSPDTRILFCTTGLLLEKLTKSKTLDHFTHIILDEVHERDKDMDFLFIVIRKLMRQNPGKVKVILMSATIEAPKFAEYFKMPKNNEMVPAPIIQIEKKSIYKVLNFYLDDFKQISQDVTINYTEPGISTEMYRLALKLISFMNKFDSNEVDNSTTSLNESKALPTILIFLPGIHEIQTFEKMLSDEIEKKPDLGWKVSVLHSLISTAEQRRVFSPVPPNNRKIILSTNIAESSITVPDVRYVIDFCLAKYLQTNYSTNLTSLSLSWASRNNCRQRSGRAGRVMNGRCYRLVSKSFFNEGMEESALPELIRCPLENIILKTKLLDMGPPYAVLALALDTPNLSDIANTILVLKELGALQRTSDGIISVHDGDLTFMGRVMANLPVDVRVSRLIVLGFCFGVLEECVIMGAGLNVKSIFVNSFKEPLTAYSRKLEWSNSTGSDLFAVLNVYNVWCSKHNQRIFGDTEEQKLQETMFGHKHFIDIRSLRECNVLVNELNARLNRMGVRKMTGLNREVWNENEKTMILKIVISGAFYPNFFVRSASGGEKYGREPYHCLNGRDPCTTVYFSGFNQRYIRQLYVSSIKELLIGKVIQKSNAANVKVAFGENSERVFITFEPPAASNTVEKDWITHRSSIPGKILTEVYKAIKMRKTQKQVTIKVLKPSDAIKAAERAGLGSIRDKLFVPNIKPENIQKCTPRLLEKTVAGTITHIDGCDRFWFRSDKEKTTLERYFDQLNPINDSRIVEVFCGEYDVQIAEIVAARKSDDNFFYRAKVLNIMPSEDDKLIFVVFFMDFGKIEECGLNNLFKFRNDIDIEQRTKSPRCFTCCLAEIQPSIVRTMKNLWDAEATVLLKQETQNHAWNLQLKIEVYSVVHDVAHVFLYINGKNFNDILIEKGYGEYCEENYLSKSNHAYRKTRQLLTKSDEVNEDYFEPFYPVEEAEEVEPPRLTTNSHTITLSGPFSPLETQPYAVTAAGASSSISIDPLSVNSILLENDLQDACEKYLVAAFLSKNERVDSKLTARDTTLLPNIAGFGPLTAAIFCPTMEVQRDKEKNRFISILTGLGYDTQMRQPVFEEHDCVFYLDVEIMQDDFNIINQIRYCLDTILNCGPESVLAIADREKTQLTLKMKQLMMKLLAKPRRLMEVHTDPHKWNQYECSDIMHIENIYGDCAIFPTHKTLKLLPLNDAQNRKFRNHCKELHNLSVIDATLPRPVLCQLCAQELETIPTLRIHLISRLHSDREKQIGYNNDNE